MQRKLSPTERSARTNKLVSLRKSAGPSWLDAPRYKMGEEPIVKLDGAVFTREITRIVGDKVVAALAAFRFDEALGREVFVGYVGADGTLIKAQVKKQEIASPATPGEILADTAAQAADRARIRAQYALERRIEELKSEATEIGSILGVHEATRTSLLREVTQELTAARNQLFALRTG